jgi:hypothetical protein
MGIANDLPPFLLKFKLNYDGLFIFTLCFSRKNSCVEDLP